MVKKSLKSKILKKKKSRKTLNMSTMKRVANIKRREKAEEKWNKKMTDIINREDAKKEAWENLRKYNLKKLGMDDITIETPVKPEKPKKPKAPTEYLEEDEEWEYPQYGDTPSDSEEEDWKYEGGKYYTDITFPQDINKPLLHQKLDDKERKEHEHYSRNLQNENLIKARVQDDRVNTLLYTKYGLEGLNNMKGNGNMDEVKNHTIIRPPEEIENIKAIENIKDTELRKRKFQQGIEKLQEKHPLDVNNVLQKLYNVLPTSQENLLDRTEKIKKLIPKTSIFNYKIEDEQIIKYKRPFLEMELKKLKDYRDYRSNIKEQRDILEKKYNVSSNERKNDYMLENKLREDDFLLKMANRIDPNKYLIDNIYKKSVERVKLNDIPTLKENIKNSQIALNAVSTKHTGKKLYPYIIPDPSYYPSQMQNILTTQYNALNR